MARRPYGGDTAVLDTTTGRPLSGGVGTLWTAETSGVQITDLTDTTGTPITTVITDADGKYEFFGPPDGTSQMWIDFGSGRFLINSTDIEGRIGLLESGSAGPGTGGGVGLPPGGDPGDVLTKSTIADGDAAWVALALATVAKSGVYGDLQGLPTIPDAYTKTQSDTRYPRTINGFAPDPTSGDVSVPLGIFAIICPSGVAPLRSTVTNDPTRIVFWFSPTSPPIASGYAINDVDFWVVTA